MRPRLSTPPPASRIPLVQLCNMDRVNMSIAILPISQQYQWTSATIGLVQSSFFWGYLLTQARGTGKARNKRGLYAGACRGSVTLLWCGRAAFRALLALYTLLCCPTACLPLTPATPKTHPKPTAGAGRRVG